MDAESWVGDDTREFGPDPLNGRCHDCGAEEDEPCSVLCACACCVRQRARKEAVESWPPALDEAYELNRWLTNGD